MKLLNTWRRIHERHPIQTSLGFVVTCLANPVLATVGLNQLVNTWLAFLLGAVVLVVPMLVMALVAELIDADRAMRIRWKMRTGEDYDAPQGYARRSYGDHP